MSTVLWDIITDVEVSEWGLRPHQHIIGHFGNESFQSITCTGTDNLIRTTKRQNTQITQIHTMQKVALVDSITHRNRIG